MCEVEMNRQEKQLKKTYQAMFEKMAVEDEKMDEDNDDGEEDVFSVNPSDDPQVVRPARKLQKARSTDTSPY